VRNRKIPPTSGRLAGTQRALGIRRYGRLAVRAEAFEVAAQSLPYFVSIHKLGWVAPRFIAIGGLLAYQLAIKHPIRLPGNNP